MIPNGAQGIAHISRRIIQDLIPKATDAYTAADLGLMTVMLAMVGQDYERVVDTLMIEQAQMATIFAAAQGVVDDPGLSARLEAAQGVTAPSLRVSDLSARADVAMSLLIDLHAAVEAAMEAGAPWAPPLDDEIWRLLDGYVARRAYDVAM